MKKQFMFAAAVMTALAFTSCKKYEVSGPLDLSELQTVTIQGNMYADLDETNTTLEKAPQGLKVTVSIPFTDYNSTAGDGNHIVTTTTDANGKFSINVPVVSDGVDATIYFESFTASVNTQVGGNSNFEKTKLFKLATQTISGLGAGNSKETLNLGLLAYISSSTSPDSASFTPTTSVTYEGIMEYERKVVTALVGGLDSTVYAPFPEGTILVVEITSKDEFLREFNQNKTVTTTAGGKYLIEVPLIKNGTANIKISVHEILTWTNKLNEDFLHLYKASYTDALHFIDYSNKDHKVNKGIVIPQ